MGLIRNSFLTQVFCGLMGIYILNMSIDAADFHPECISEDLSFNDQESIVELVVEQILGFEKAFKEYDDHDSTKNHQKKEVKNSMDAHRILSLEIPPSIERINKLRHGEIPFVLTKGSKEFDTPPPKI